MEDQKSAMPSEDPHRCKNYFVQRVLAEFFQGSPVLRVRDACQPSHGSLRRNEGQTDARSDLSSFHAKSELVLKHKALHNEDLLPAPVSSVDLTGVGASTLMMKRRNLRLGRFN